VKKRQQIASLSVAIALGISTALSSGIVNAAEIIEGITVVGAQRVEPETVRTYLSVQEGDDFSSRQINRSLKKLFATGLFADVTIKREGQNLVVNVEGNRKLDDETLDTEVTLRPRVIYTRTRVQQDVERILTLYRRSGRLQQL